MRKLTDSERLYVQNIFKQKAKTIATVMKFFKVFGSLQIIAIIAYILFGKAPSSDIPFMLVGCVILFLVYFKLTNFLANQNQWRKLLNVVNKKMEFVYECELISTYETSHGDSHSAKEFMANILVNGKEIRCNASSKLKEVAPGSRIALICTTSFIENSMKYAIPIINNN